MNRNNLIGMLAAAVLAICQTVDAQQSGKIARVGVLFVGGKDQPHWESFKQGLRELGYEVRPLRPGYRELVEAGFERAPDDRP